MYKGQLFCTNHPVKMIRENTVVLLITSLIFLSLVGVSIGQSDSDSCIYQGQRVSGEFTIPGYCLVYRCIPGQGVTAVGCGINIPPEGCYVQHPENKNYPECCYTNIVCPEANTINPQQVGQISDNFNVSSIENLGYPKKNYGLPPAPFTASTRTQFSSPQPKFPTERPELINTLTPPAPDGTTAAFKYKSNKKRPNGSFAEPQNQYVPPREEFIGSGPYYYKK